MSLPSLRVLMTVDAVGGVWVYATNLARSLCERGCHVRLVTLGPPPRKDQVENRRWGPCLFHEDPATAHSGPLTTKRPVDQEP